LDAAAFRRTVGETENVLQGRPTNYVLSNHDNPRAFDKFGDGKHNDEIAKLLALMLLTLHDAPVFYYGEEIGMKTTPPERLEDVRDPVGKVYWPRTKGVTERGRRCNGRAGATLVSQKQIRPGCPFRQ